MATTARPRTTQQVPDVTRRLSAEQKAAALPLPKHLTSPQGIEAGLRQINQAKRLPKGVVATQSGMVDPRLLNQMQTNQAPQEGVVTMYAPGAPLPPIAGINAPEGPRQYDYPVGVNILSLPRAEERTSFQQLRDLADMYEGIRLCERVWFDVLNRLELKITFKPGIIPDGESDTDPKWQKIIQPAYEFLCYPDRERSLSDWMIASVGDILEIGQSPVYINRARNGKLLSLDLIDGAMIKPLLDQRGRMPIPPYPAYEQFVKGVPASLYMGNVPQRPLTASNIEMLREMSRTHDVYSRSRVEDILLILNIALRKQDLDMARYTDGAVPAGIIVAKGDSNYTLEETEEFQRLVNGELAGNSRIKQRLKILPPGLVESIQITQQKDPEMTLDRFCLNVCTGAFGVTMDEIGMTENSNRSVGDSQENVTYRRIVQPLATRYAKFLTRIAREFDARLVAQWTGIDESEDLSKKASYLHIGVQAGALSPSDMAHMMGWKVDREIPAFMVVPGGPAGIVVLDDIDTIRQQNAKANETAQATKDAGLKIQQLQGKELEGQLKQQAEQAQNPDQGQDDQQDNGNQSSSDDGNDNGGQDNGGDQSGDDQGGQGQGADNSNDDQGNDGEGDQQDNAPPQKKGKRGAQRADVASLAQALRTLTISRQRVAAPKPVIADPRAVSDEWARWKDKALRLAKQGKAQVAFTSTVIPVTQHVWVAERLVGVLPPEVVRGVFAEAREREADAMRHDGHTHRFVAQRCLVCGCGEPYNSHDEGLPTLQPEAPVTAAPHTDVPQVSLGISKCPVCHQDATSVTETGSWYSGMVCPTCGHQFIVSEPEAAPDTAVVDELRMLRADVLRALEY